MMLFTPFSYLSLLLPAYILATPITVSSDTSAQDPSYKPSIHARAGLALEPAEADYTAELTLYTPESQDEDISEAFAAGISNVVEVVLPSILPFVHVEHRNKVRVNLEKFLSFRVTQLTYCASPPHSDDDNLSRDHYMVDVKLKDKSNQPLDFLDHTLYFLKSVYDAAIGEQFIAAYVVRLQDGTSSLLRTKHSGTRLTLFVPLSKWDVGDHAQEPSNTLKLTKKVFFCSRRQRRGKVGSRVLEQCL
ncbi:hypothetical protein F5880DRAFT_276615 [Lentinula raphanica]|nr:hypothetical protein F5880DRAFT_276615 [Lentinula raphanica]